MPDDCSADVIQIEDCSPATWHHLRRVTERLGILRSQSEERFGVEERLADYSEQFARDRRPFGILAFVVASFDGLAFEKDVFDVIKKIIDVDPGDLSREVAYRGRFRRFKSPS